MLLHFLGGEVTLCLQPGDGSAKRDFEFIPHVQETGKISSRERLASDRSN